MLKKQFLKVKISLLDFKIFFIELKGKQLRDKEIKIKRETEQLFFKPIIVTIDNMDELEKKKK